MNISRRTFLKKIIKYPLFTGPLLGVSVFSYMKYLEPYWFEITEKNIPNFCSNNNLTILHLSDLHHENESSLEGIHKSITLALQYISKKNQKFDAIFITGDFITWKLNNENNYAKALKQLAQHAPTYACIGNHDGGLWAKSSHGYKNHDKISNLLKKSNIKLLFNQTHEITIKNEKLKIVGLGDIWSHDEKPHEVLPKYHSDDLNKSQSKIILLSHNPDSIKILEKYHWNLMLCGHTHGGQLIIPFINYRPFIPIKDTKFSEGLHKITYNQNKEKYQKYCHITRGIGNIHGMRLNCRPEISILNLKKDI